MQSLKVSVMVLVLMSVPSMADFTVKDLFVPGGTKAEKSKVDKKSASKKEKAKSERYDQDCI